MFFMWERGGFMNIQHSSRTDVWLTPLWLVKAAQEVLGRIDLDPATCDLAQTRIGALTGYQERGLELPWYGTIFLNPPGGKLGNRSQAALWWQRLMLCRDSELLDHAIFVAFSAEALQTTQRVDEKSLCDFPLCVPKKRIRFDNYRGTPGDAPSHSNVIVYVPGRLDHTRVFQAVFGPVGALMGPL
jgi:hypothetical protein